MGLNPILVSALAPFGLVEVGAEIGAELDNFALKDHRTLEYPVDQIILNFG